MIDHTPYRVLRVSPQTSSLHVCPSFGSGRLHSSSPFPRFDLLPNLILPWRSKLILMMSRCHRCPLRRCHLASSSPMWMRLPLLHLRLPATSPPSQTLLPTWNLQHSSETRTILIFSNKSSKLKVVAWRG